MCNFEVAERITRAIQVILKGDMDIQERDIVREEFIMEKYNLNHLHIRQAALWAFENIKCCCTVYDFIAQFERSIRKTSLISQKELADLIINSSELRSVLKEEFSIEQTFTLDSSISAIRRTTFKQLLQ